MTFTPSNGIYISESLFYVITCAFLFYVFMCASLLDTVIGQNMREFIKYHSSVQHILGVVFLVFTIGVITSHKTIFVFMYSLCVYAWFLVVSKLPGEWNMIILTPLMACFILSALLHREAIDEWEGSELDRSIKRKRMLSAIDPCT